MSSPTPNLFRENINFRRLYYATFVSTLGDWFNSIAVTYLVLQLTHSSLVVSLTFLMRVLPYLFIGPLAGVIGDRFKRTHIMITSDLVRAVFAIGFLFVHTGSNIWLIYVFTALLVIFSAFFVPARSAYLSSIVDKSSLGQANSSLGGLRGVVLALGQGLGGVVIAFFGIQIAFIFNAISFLFSAWLFRTSVKEEKHPVRTDQEKNSTWNDFLVGIRHIREHKAIALSFLLIIGYPLGGGVTAVIVPVMSDQVFHQSSIGLGLFFLVMGAGGFIGSRVNNRWLKAGFQHRLWLVGVFHIIAALAQFLFAVSPNPFIANLAVAIIGFFETIGTAAVTTHLALNSPSHVQSRVFSVYNSVNFSVLGTAVIAAGLFIPFIGPRVCGEIGSTLIVVFCLAFTLLTLPSRRSKQHIAA